MLWSNVKNNAITSTCNCRSAWNCCCWLSTSCFLWLAIASETSLFITPGVNIGLFCSTPMAISRSLGRKTMEMLLTGESLTAEDAEKFGLINKVSLNQLKYKTLKFAKHIASKPSSTIKIEKRLK